MIRSVGYPIIIDLGADFATGGQYAVEIDGSTVFVGMSFNQSVDIAPVLREYLNSEPRLNTFPDTEGLANGVVDDIYMAASVSVVGGIISVVTLDVNSGEVVVADYNHNAESIIHKSIYLTSEWVNNKIDPRMIFYVGVVSDLDGNNDVLISEDGSFDNIISADDGSTVITADDNSAIGGQVIEQITISRPLSSYIYSARFGGETGIMSVQARAGGEMTEPLILSWDDRCPRYAIYAVNRKGGITSLLCDGRPTESFGVKRFDVQTFYDRSNPVGRETRRVNTQTTRKWRLNTGKVGEQWAHCIDDIASSPKIVLHDLQTDRLYAVNCTDASIERKLRVNNRRRILEYTLNFDEAREEVRW